MAIKVKSIRAASFAAAAAVAVAGSVGAGCAHNEAMKSPVLTGPKLPPQFAAAQFAPMAVDAKWTEYGTYLQPMIESVQKQWERLIVESKVTVKEGSIVTVKFIMNSRGEIARIVNVESTANDKAARACLSAITDRSPYGAWTEGMKAVLGEQQEMTFSFYYQ